MKGRFISYRYRYHKYSNYMSESLSMSNNNLFHIGYEARVPSAFYDHIPIIQKMIDSFEVLTKSGISNSETF
jgi:hypothetical protein